MTTPATDICSECGGQIDREKRPSSMTCGDTCKSRRWRRLTGRSGGTADANLEAAMAAIDPEEVAREVVATALAPYARDALTKDVLASLKDMVALTPELVESLRKDLTSSDPNARGNAQRLIAKFTFGAVTEQEATRAQPMTVVLPGMPTPAAPEPAAYHGAAVPAEAVELRECDRCHIERPLSDFQQGARRCTPCQDEIKASVLAEYSTP